MKCQQHYIISKAIEFDSLFSYSSRMCKKSVLGIGDFTKNYQLNFLILN